jgi:hypothetical protein
MKRRKIKPSRFSKILKIIIITIVITCRSFSQERVYDIISYGAIADGETSSTSVIQKAIDDAHKNGGGTVLIKAGKFITGVITLKSEVCLHLAEGATLLGSTKRADYGPQDASALIEAKDQQNISITGPGTIDGRGRELVKDIYRMLEEGTLQDPEWKRKRPTEKNRPQIISFVNCTNIKIKGIILKDASSWVQNYRKCNNLIIDSIRVESTAYWNNDGIDIVNCKDVTITNSLINSADDGICLKSEGEPEGICENIYVANCTIRSSASAFKIGTGSHGGFKNVTVKNLTIYDTYRSAIAIECVDGGILESVTVQNITARNTGNAIFIRLGHRNQKKPAGQLRDIYISNMRVEVPKGKPDKGYETEGPPVKVPHNVFPSSITGIPGHPAQNITLENIEIIYEGGADKNVAYFAWDSLARVPERVPNYPEFSMFGELPAWGFYVRHVKGLIMKNIRLSTRECDFRPACIFDDVNNLNLQKINISAANVLPVVILNETENSNLQKIRLPVSNKKGILIQKTINKVNK